MLYVSACCLPFFVYNELGEEVEVTYQNWSETLGQKKRYKHISTNLRHELSKMIFREIISQDDLDRMK
ncbi:hypothetical protein GCM10011516_14800 [Sphingobacterium cellulitidis]|uniref:Uncharacterized protein n=1 Tax=Sphingobacterium cellulitidis TaxID=1768011 RepID=A0A8H9G099_9SPHI|nr:hypothetical protein GCM10011516_14800 [Sphingobacterium soli]